jgi:hypothetical protein
MTDSGIDVYSLAYNALQFSVQRRLSKGLQLGLAYTFSKAMGEQGWDPYTADPSLTIANVGGTVAGGASALHDRYWGPTNTDRRHNMTLNYSYQIPNTLKNTPFLKWVLADWQVSGVTKWLSGTAANPSCGSNNAGVANSNPSFSIYPVSNFGNGNIAARCNLTGAPINALERVDVDPANPDPLTATYFNLGAFAMATPISSTVGNFGNAPLGLLRNPSYSTWDMTLARRIPIKLGRNGGVRLQLQAYNIFNQLRFTSISTGMTFTGANNATLNSTTVGRVNQNSVISPRQLGLTIRLDF